MNVTIGMNIDGGNNKSYKKGNNYAYCKDKEYILFHVILVYSLTLLAKNDCHFWIYFSSWMDT